MRFRLAAALLAAAWSVPAAADCDPAHRGQPFEIAVERLDLGPADWRGLDHLGTVRLRSENTALGGLSGLLIEEGGTRLIAVGDRGRWFTATLARGADGVVSAISDATHHRIRGPRGRLKGNFRDAEDLSRLGADILVSFERAHRVMLCARGDRLEAWAELDDWGDLEFNASLESVATMPDGRVITIAEANNSTFGFPYWVLGGPESEDEPIRGYLPQTDRHHVTSAEYGPGGVLYVLERDFSALRGVSIRVVRYWPDRDGLPLPESQELLAQFESNSGIDNMEALALWTDEQGRLRLTMISDDNFSPLQRTILVDTVVRRP